MAAAVRRGRSNRKLLVAASSPGADLSVSPTSPSTVEVAHPDLAGPAAPGVTAGALATATELGDSLTDQLSLSRSGPRETHFMHVGPEMAESPRHAGSITASSPKARSVSPPARPILESRERRSVFAKGAASLLRSDEERVRSMSVGSADIDIGSSTLEPGPTMGIAAARATCRSYPVRKVGLNELDRLERRALRRASVSARDVRDEMKVEVPVERKPVKVLGFQAPAKAMVLLGEGSDALAQQERRLLRRTASLESPSGASAKAQTLLGISHRRHSKPTGLEREFIPQKARRMFGARR